MAEDTLSFDFCSDKRFYVYLYRDSRPGKENRPIYVGKGVSFRNRAFVHWRRGARNFVLAAILAKVKKAGLTPKIEIVAWFDDEQAAFNLEKELIVQFGRRDQGCGPLTNRTDGGEGTSGQVVSVETRMKQSKAHRADWANASAEKRSKILMNFAWGDPKSDVSRIQAMKSARNIAWSDPQRRAAHIAASVATKRANIDKIRAKSNEYYSNESSEKRALRIKAASDAARRNAVATGQRTVVQWADPVHKAARSDAISKAQKAAWADPEKRLKRMDALLATRQKKPRN